MTTNSGAPSREPRPDEAEDNAFFPSPYSLTQYVPPRSDFDGVEHEGAYTEGRWKILAIATEERYLLCRNGKMFSTGNHPVETLLPLIHLMKAGFEVEIATVAGYPAKLEWWAMPGEDEAVRQAYESLKPKFKEPKKLSDVVAGELGDDSDYLAVFIPGGHGALLGLPDAEAVAHTLDWALDRDKYIITLCHGPAALLAVGRGGRQSPFEGYSMCVFPDALDEGANVDMGYIPGHLPWLLAEALQAQGITVLNDDMTGRVHRDRTLLSGDSPLAANNLGLLAADVLVQAVTPQS
ncbi:protein deglycase HchA [Mycolicibacterium obuense]|uniref:Protein deglycase HchA n=1 Tax=Mycolicibacterium obuense TaxID=1807 RepID=A0A4R5XAY1_9MYCO|nr:glyoxalase III HchA [Mycolicibacterium obuense]TDL11763.1 protein deglycase HchA [Mycolicibacterium obuense]